VFGERLSVQFAAEAHVTASTAATPQALIERWDGTSWAIATSPSTGNYPYGMTCASASDCWAVGWYNNGISAQTHIERWDGT